MQHRAQPPTPPPALSPRPPLRTSERTQPSSALLVRRGQSEPPETGGLSTKGLPRAKGLEREERSRCTRSNTAAASSAQKLWPGPAQPDAVCRWTQLSGAHLLLPAQRPPGNMVQVEEDDTGVQGQTQDPGRKEEVGGSCMLVWRRGSTGGSLVGAGQTSTPTQEAPNGVCLMSIWQSLAASSCQRGQSWGMRAPPPNLTDGWSLPAARGGDLDENKDLLPRGLGRPGQTRRPKGSTECPAGARPDETHCPHRSRAR